MDEVVNTPVVADATPTESTAVETASTEVADDSAFDAGFDDGEVTSPKPKTPEVEEPLELDEPDGEQKEQTPETDANEPEEPRGKAEDRKQQLNTEIRDLVAQRNAIKSEVERLNSEVYQPSSEQDLLGQINPETGEYFNSLEAKVTAMEQRQEIERYNNQVADAQLTLSSEATRALSDFPMFDANSPDYKPEIAAGVDQILGQNLIFDPNTKQVVGSNISPYQLYKTVAEAARLSAVNGQIAGQKATEKMLANADTPANAPVKSAREDSFLKGFDDNF